MLIAFATASSNEIVNGYGRTVSLVNPCDGYQIARSRTQERRPSEMNEAAAELGIVLKTLYNKLNQYQANAVAG